MVYFCVCMSDSHDGALTYNVPYTYPSHQPEYICRKHRPRNHLRRSDVFFATFVIDVCPAIAVLVPVLVPVHAICVRWREPSGR